MKNEKKVNISLYFREDSFVFFGCNRENIDEGVEPYDLFPVMIPSSCGQIYM